MTKSEMLKRFTVMRDKCRNPKVKLEGYLLTSEGDEYREIYELLGDTETLDENYSDNMRSISKKTGDDISRTGNLTFRECCTALTFVLRSEHWNEGSFAENLQNGTVYKLLNRAVEMLV